MLLSFSVRALTSPDGDQIEAVQTWRDLGDARWLVAAAGAGAWLVLFCLGAWKAKPRRVRPGPDALDLVGDESPAVVNLITNSWSLEHEAVPATLLDLAARGHVSIRQTVEDQSAAVYVPLEPPARAAAEPLLRYERMVLKHVRRLARRTSDGIVPAAALTTGPDDQAKRWWRRFRVAVYDDARDRGLAERRWSRGTKLALMLLAVVAAAPAGFAFSAAVYANGSDGDVVGGGATYAVVLLIALAVLVGTRGGVADTPAGREAAARWLGLRAMLSTDPLFAEHHPSGVDVWGRKLAYGAAMGIAHGAVHTLPMGAENDREVWSHVSGSWRVVHVRYPRWWSSIGYGGHPFLSVFQGLLLLCLGGWPVVMVSQTSGETLGPSSPLFTATAVPFGLIALAGLWAILRGLADLVTPRQAVEGRVVRRRRKGTGKGERWYVVVDDGTASHLSAWKFDHTPNFGLDAFVRARVTRRLSHVSHLEVLDASETVVPPEDERSVQVLPGARPEVVLAQQLAARTNDGAAADDVRWPDATAISERIGRPVDVDERVSSHPMAEEGQSVAYRDGDGLIHVVRINRHVFTRFRRPRFLNQPVPEVGDEAYRLKVGGALLARRGDEAVMVAVHLPGEPTVERDRISKTVARQGLESVRRATLDQAVWDEPEPALKD